jgi:hypothetical protein
LNRLAGIFIILLVQSVVFGQNFSNLRQKTIHPSDSVMLDSLSIVPGSLIASSQTHLLIENSDYTVDYARAVIYFSSEQKTAKSISLTYRVFPVDLTESLSKPLQFKANDTLYHQKQFQPVLLLPKNNVQAENENLIEVNGMLARGISVGNNQNMGVNSTLNLQLKGKLSPNIWIDAVLSDKSVPMQPDGYSQQINEFDQIYIRLYNEQQSMQMGDVLISGSESHFLKFDRKVQGLDLKINLNPESKTIKAKSQVSAAVAKGSFNRMEFTGTEGVQGPYVLKGANNELYVVVLAGTEKVYLDGQLLTRGEQADYIMDYNTAELTFTARYMVSNQSRIIVEYEYSDENYNRFLFYTNNQLTYKTNKFSLQYFTEGDAKNQAVNMELSTEDKSTLALAGDDVSQSIASNIDSVAFSLDKVLYKMVDTLVNGILYDSILVYSNNSGQAFYQAGFALMGDNNGNYTKEISTTNGRLYQWVAPVNDVPQGNYEPIQVLIAPKTASMVVANAVFKPGKQIQIETELAYSQKDLNTFSTLDAADNKGFALKTNFEQHIVFKNSTFIPFVHYQFTQQHFNAIQRFRSTEFERDWNLLTDTIHNENWMQVGIDLSKGKNMHVLISQELLDKGTFFNGKKSNLEANWQFKNLFLNTSANYLRTKGTVSSSEFYRHKIAVAYGKKQWRFGINHNFENNQLIESQTDTLLSTSQKFSEAIVYLNLGDSVGKSFDISYKNRHNFLPLKTSLQKASVSDDVALSASIPQSKVGMLKTTLTWRQLAIVNDSLLPNQKNEQNLLGSIEHQINFRKRLLSFYTFYEIGSGLEASKEYAYLEVTPGQGIYSWIDMNGNSIPELDEFELSAIPEEANYIKIYTPTNEYIKVYTIKMNETISLRPDAVWKREQGFKKLASHFSNQFNWRIIQKHTRDNLLARLNPLQNESEDSVIINTNLSVRNTFSFNRNHPKFGADYTFNRQQQKNLLVNGFDVSKLEQHEVKLRWNISSEIVLLNTLGQKNRIFDSEYFTSKNYAIQSEFNQTTLQWQPGTKFRISLNYNIKQKNNSLGIQSLIYQETGTEIKLNSPQKGSVTLSAAFINNRFSGDQNTTAAYTMLEGLTSGENYKWAVHLTRNLNSFLRLTINYNGRKPALLKVIHTGQFSLVAFF